MSIHQEDFDPACTKPGCTHKDECVALAPACHQSTQVLDERGAVSAQGTAVKALYALATGEIIIRCAVCNAIVTTVAVAKRGNNLTMVKTTTAQVTAPQPAQQKQTRKARDNRARKR